MVEEPLVQWTDSASLVNLKYKTLGKDFKRQAREFIERHEEFVSQSAADGRGPLLCIEDSVDGVAIDFPSDMIVRDPKYRMAILEWSESHSQSMKYPPTGQEPKRY